MFSFSFSFLFFAFPFPSFSFPFVYLFLSLFLSSSTTYQRERTKWPHWVLLHALQIQIGLNWRLNQKWRLTRPLKKQVNKKKKGKDLNFFFLFDLVFGFFQKEKKENQKTTKQPEKRKWKMQNEKREGKRKKQTKDSFVLRKA